MNGQQLYEQYLASLLQLQNCTADSWGELPDDDKAVWNDVALWAVEQAPKPESEWFP